MAKGCTCKASEVLLFPCSGASNCGQITNQVAASLDVMGAGRMYCLAGLGAHDEGMVESSKKAKRIMALDGCPTGCSRGIIEHAGIKITDSICVTEAGIIKNHDIFVKQEDVESVTRQVIDLLSKTTYMKMVYIEQ